MRRTVPGASFFFVTSPSRVSERSAIHGPCDIDTGCLPGTLIRSSSWGATPACGARFPVRPYAVATTGAPRANTCGRRSPVKIDWTPAHQTRRRGGVSASKGSSEGGDAGERPADEELLDLAGALV